MYKFNTTYTCIWQIRWLSARK